MNKLTRLWQHPLDICLTFLSPVAALYQEWRVEGKQRKALLKKLKQVCFSLPYLPDNALIDLGSPMGIFSVEELESLIPQWYNDRKFWYNFPLSNQPKVKVKSMWINTSMGWRKAWEVGENSPIPFPLQVGSE